MRPYKEAMSHDEAVAIILRSSGTQFDPAIVEAFLRHENDFKTLGEELVDSTGRRGPRDADHVGAFCDTANARDLEAARSL